MTAARANIEFDDATITVHRQALRAFIRRRVAGAAEAEDLVQEAFARLYSASNSRDITDPQAYLFRIAANLITDYRRRNGRMGEHADLFGETDICPVPPAQEYELRRADLQNLFETALNELPPRQRQVFVMRRFEERETLDIALRLFITPRMVQKHLSLAVAHLHERLRPYMDDRRD